MFAAKWIRLALLDYRLTITASSDSVGHVDVWSLSVKTTLSVCVPFFGHDGSQCLYLSSPSSPNSCPVFCAARKRLKNNEAEALLRNGALEVRGEHHDACVYATDLSSTGTDFSPPYWTERG